MGGSEDLFLHADFDFLFVEQVFKPRVVLTLKLALAALELLEARCLLGNELLYVLVLTAEIGYLLLEPSPGPDGLFAPVKDIDGIFCRVTPP